MKEYKSNVVEYQLKKINSEIKKAKITSSQDAADYVKEFYKDDIEIYESLFIVLLNRANITEGWVKISQGGTAGTVIDVKLIAKYAIQSLASSVIIVHNHPTGNINPSNADINITKKTNETLKICDINLLDHIIITKDNGYYSLADNGLIS